MPLAASRRLSTKSTSPLSCSQTLIRQSERNFILLAVGRGPGSALGLTGECEKGALVDIEIELDRIEREDVRQDRLVRDDEIALGHELARDSSRQWRFHLRELDVELRLPQRRLRPVHFGLACQEGLTALVEELVGDVARAAQLLGAVEIALREFQPDLRGGDGRLRLFEHVTVGSRIDGEEEITRLDEGAVLEMNLVEIARDPGADIDLIDGLEAPDEIGPLDDVLHHGLRDGDGRRRLAGASLSLGAFAQHEPRQQNAESEHGPGRAHA